MLGEIILGLLLVELLAVDDDEVRAGLAVKLVGSKGGGPICCSCCIIVLSIAARGLSSSTPPLALTLGKSC